MNMDDLGVPPFQETFILTLHQDSGMFTGTLLDVPLLCQDAVVISTWEMRKKETQDG